MTAPRTCPSCATPLALFTPREATAHVNACLDAAPPSPTSAPVCAVCDRDLTALTTAARAEHANRCADSLLALPPATAVAAPPAGRRRRAGRPRADPAPAPVPAAPAADPRVDRLLELLGLARYAPRFAAEEIDLVALRLLTDDDLAQLHVPEAARRRIADALHSVPILAQLQAHARAHRAGAATQRAGGVGGGSGGGGGGGSGERRGMAGAGRGEEVVADERPPDPTQRLPESRLASRMRPHTASGLDDDDDDDDDFEYLPSQHAPSALADQQRKPPFTPVGRKAALAPSKQSWSPLKGSMLQNSDKDANSLSPTPPRSPRPRSSSRAQRAEASLPRIPSPQSPDSPLSDYSSPPAPPIPIGVPSAAAQGVTEPPSVRHPVRRDSPRSGPSRVPSPDSGGSEEEQCTPLASDLGDLESALPVTSQISMDRKLRAWREQHLRRERERHRRALDDIERQYENALRKLSRTGKDSAPGTARKPTLPTTTPTRLEVSIDLTEDLGGLGVGRRAETDDDNPKRRRGSSQDVCVVSSGESSADNRTANGQCQEENAPLERADNDSSTSSLSPIDFTFDGRSKDTEADETGASKEKENEDIFKTPEHAKHRDGNDSDEDILDLVSDEEATAGQNAGDRDSDDEHSRTRQPLDFGSEAEEDVINLLSSEREAGQEAESSTAARRKTRQKAKSKPGPASRKGPEASVSTARSEDPLRRPSSPEAETQSRLKKKRKKPKATKAGRAEIIEAIKKDEALYDQVLAMESVPFEQLMERVQATGFKVAKNTMFNFLVQEGISFGGEPSKPGSQAFFKRLNNDRRIPTD